MPGFDQVASNKALAIPGIVEIILLHLDIRTVLTKAQRTCRTWNNVIQEFPSIQKHLFFEPTEEIDGEKIPNPLLAEVFPSFFPLDLKKFSAQSLDIVRNPR
ncbi:hypothetical protein N7481_012802 [Penicillium waksmanii]|uniref:uncharacterized protein n=1 Tax=Penicillium waksmanii TaxID=69791 RepID=UPI002547D1F8|nr:uncharacterized protein N7481_012802 [Penicillium waksmanii]KAJ5966088.1 hypothetical protein N7481_012802 [Penicillium waksmanii]